MSDEIPDTMKRLVVTAPGKDVASCKIEIEQVPVPTPASNEVLIKVSAAAVNPSDYGSWYRAKPENLPFAMGKEGCGVVVATGGDFSTYRVKVGAKVGFAGLKNNQGSYSEYVVASAMDAVFPMPADMPIEAAASFMVNPYTALGILDTVKSAEGAKAFIHTAAASQLGQMIVKLAPSEGIEVINVVRREEQAQLLKDIGAKHVVVTGGGNDDSWKETLKTLVDELGATVAFDAVAGEMSGDLFDVLPPFKGSLYIYGGLAGRVANIDPMGLIYHQKKLNGFYLMSWIKRGGVLGMLPRMLSAGKKVNSGLEGGWSSTQFKDTTMENVQADLVKLLEGSATGQKLRVRLD